MGVVLYSSLSRILNNRGMQWIVKGVVTLYAYWVYPSAVMRDHLHQSLWDECIVNCAVSLYSGENGYTRHSHADSILW